MSEPDFVIWIILKKGIQDKVDFIFLTEVTDEKFSCLVVVGGGGGGYCRRCFVCFRCRKESSAIAPKEISPETETAGL